MAGVPGLVSWCPDGVVVDDWILQILTSLAIQRARLDRHHGVVTIDGHEGRVMGFCGVPPAPQIEATVVVGKRVYLFTLFWSRGRQRSGGSGVVR